MPTTNSVTFTGQIPPDNTVSVIYSTTTPLQSFGDYDNRIFNIIVTNTDGDGYVELGDAEYSWRTGEFDPGDYWVTVTAEDIGGNVSSAEMLCTIAGVVQPDISLPEDSHDFGPILPLHQKIWYMPVINLGSDPLSIRSVALTNPAFTAALEHFFVPADSGVVELGVTFHGGLPGSYSGTLEMTTNDPDEPYVMVALEGTVRDPASVEDGPTAAAAFGIRGVRSLPDGTVDIVFSLEKTAVVDIAIYDAAGRLVNRHRFEDRPAGRQSWIWNGSGGAGRALPSGVYYVTLNSGGRTASATAVLVR